MKAWIDDSSSIESSTSSTVVAFKRAVGSDPTQTLGVGRPGRYQMRGDAALAISQAELANDIDQCRIGNAGRRRIGGRLESVMAADRDQPGIGLQMAVDRADQAQQPTDFDIDRIDQRCRIDVEYPAADADARPMHDHAHRPGECGTDRSTRFVARNIGRAWNQTGMPGRERRQCFRITRHGDHPEVAGQEALDHHGTESAGGADNDDVFLVW